VAVLPKSVVETAVYDEEGLVDCSIVLQSGRIQKIELFSKETKLWFHVSLTPTLI
jgi:hypothetical protein